MRNIKLVDAVIQLHDIARLVEQEVGEELGSDIIKKIRLCADELHLYSIMDDKANTIAHTIIDQAKE